ncbi:MAG: metalloregulator ArsR/SmtB family transcription factor [Terriglobia bacterium]
MKRITRTFKALTDETRLRILHLLIEAGEICVCDMETVLGCPQARISRHLSVLKNAGLIEDRREGLWILYSLTRPGDSNHRSIVRALKEVVDSAEEFAADKKKLRQAVQQGRCKTFQIIMPDSLPRAFSH